MTAGQNELQFLKPSSRVPPLCGLGARSLFAQRRVPLFYAFFFLPGVVPARTLRALSMSRSDQSRTLTVPTLSNGGALMVPAAMCRWSVRIVRPSFLAASRVEYFSFTIHLISGSSERVNLHTRPQNLCGKRWVSGCAGRVTTASPSYGRNSLENSSRRTTRDAGSEDRNANV